MNHLQFYREHGISPVYYAGNREQHFQRRASLYRALRLPPLAFRGSRVLEVAAGTGQNAEYLATLGASYLELVEPNPLGWTAPHLTKTTLEEYTPPRQPFDIVICENWLGIPEMPLLPKLAEMVGKYGVLVLTCIHPQGIYPNMLRRRLAEKLVTDQMSFGSKTHVLVSAFETHLATIKDMTRSPKDWVQDMLLNPAVDHIGVTFPMLVEALSGFEVLGTSPEFAADWRWFKSLHGEKRNFNGHALTEYYRHTSRFQHYEDKDWGAGLDEAHELLSRETLSIGEVRTMKHFNSVFGRETIHVSFQKIT